MRVGIITFHFVSNQGAVLQCYATQAFLERSGHEAVVIDYRPGYHTIRHRKNKNPITYAAWHWKKHRVDGLLRRVGISGKSFLRAILLTVSKDERRCLDEFDLFVRKNLKLTELYTSLDQLKNNPPSADAYVCGSDQLWNPRLLNQEFDKAYFLDFGDDQIARVSYAVSMGEKQGDSYLTKLGSYCKNLDAVSLREYDKDVIAAIGGDVHICIDPTLLFDASDYERLESEVVEKDPYIFVYGFEDSQEMHRAVEMAKSHYGCRVINGTPHGITIKDAENLKAYGPDRFLSLIRDAECVVTNSFHGTAFSVVYKKSFITVMHSTRGGRMTNLLERLQLVQRLWGSEEFSFDEPIDWERAYGRLDELREYSGKYLLSAIQGVPGDQIPHGGMSTLV